ncbi:UNVERIFIED_CONTAM: hypothetical protein H355_010012 [Colinus virginianus]|nr:hypothetical protein H355_010012 [Colinus virginianus]
MLSYNVKLLYRQHSGSICSIKSLLYASSLAQNFCEAADDTVPVGRRKTAAVLNREEQRWKTAFRPFRWSCSSTAGKCCSRNGGAQVAIVTKNACFNSGTRFSQRSTGSRTISSRRQMAALWVNFEAPRTPASRLRGKYGQNKRGKDVRNKEVTRATTDTECTTPCDQRLELVEHDDTQEHGQRGLKQANPPSEEWRPEEEPDVSRAAANPRKPKAALVQTTEVSDIGAAARLARAAREKRSKYYVLSMIPYPSGEGLHIGHCLTYTVADVVARYKRLQLRAELLWSEKDGDGGTETSLEREGVGEQPQVQQQLQPVDQGAEMQFNVPRDNVSSELCNSSGTNTIVEESGNGRSTLTYDQNIKQGSSEEAPRRPRNNTEAPLPRVPTHSAVEPTNGPAPRGGSRPACGCERPVQAVSEKGGRATLTQRPKDKYQVLTRAAQQPDVMHVMGWDAFGLPAEQHALASGIPPRLSVRKNIERFRHQLQRLGLAVDWRREIDTSDPAYFRWTQWIFLQMWKRGLVYEKAASVNWCEALGTVLADEEVVDGVSTRGQHPVEKRRLKQWHLRITAYADELENSLHSLEWPEDVKIMQSNWIGKRELLYVTLPLLRSSTVTCKRLLARESRDANRQAAYDDSVHASGESVPEHDSVAEVFTRTYGLPTINVLARGADRKCASNVMTRVAGGSALELQRDKHRALPKGEERECVDGPVQDTIINSQSAALTLNGLSRLRARRQVLEHLRARNIGEQRSAFALKDWVFSRQRFWGEPIPLVRAYTAEGRLSVLAESETNLPVVLPEEMYRRRVGPAKCYSTPTERLGPTASTGSSSGEHRCMKNVWQAEEGHQSGEEAPVSPEDDRQTYLHHDSLMAPLADYPQWWNLTPGIKPTTATVVERLPQHTDRNVVAATTNGASKAEKKQALVELQREVSTMPQWAGSSWYFLRFLDPHNSYEAFNKESARYWMPVDLYVGGKEHAVTHLLYARFWHKVLRDLGSVTCGEPFKRLCTPGIMLGTPQYVAFQRLDTGKWVSANSVSLKKGNLPESHVRQEPRTNNCFADQRINPAKTCSTTSSEAGPSVSILSDQHDRTSGTAISVMMKTPVNVPSTTKETAGTIRGTPVKTTSQLDAVAGVHRPSGQAVREVKIENAAVTHVKGSKVAVLKEDETIQVIRRYEKMSKSRGNVISPDSLIEAYGADALRLHLLFMGPVEARKVWSLDGIKAFEKTLLKHLIERVTRHIERLAFNTALAALIVQVPAIFLNDESALEEYVKGDIRVARIYADTKILRSVVLLKAKLVNFATTALLLGFSSRIVKVTTQPPLHTKMRVQRYEFTTSFQGPAATAQAAPFIPADEVIAPGDTTRSSSTGRPKEKRTLWMGDLDRAEVPVDEAYVRSDMFMEFNNFITHVRVCRDKLTRLPSFGFVEFATEKHASYVLEHMNGRFVPRRCHKYKLNWASFNLTEKPETRVTFSRPPELHRNHESSAATTESNGKRTSDAAARSQCLTAPPSDSTSIWVGSLDPATSREEVETLFQQHYNTVCFVKLIADNSTGLCRGFGFVHFRSAEEAERALGEMNGAICRGRRIRVNRSNSSGGRSSGVGTQGSAQDPNVQSAMAKLYAATAYQAQKIAKDYCGGFVPTKRKRGVLAGGATAKVAVRGLDPVCREEEIEKHLSHFGEILHTKVVPGGKAYVTFAEPAAAENAVTYLSGCFIGANRVLLEHASDTHTDAGAGTVTSGNAPHYWSSNTNGAGYAVAAQVGEFSNLTAATGATTGVCSGIEAYWNQQQPLATLYSGCGESWQTNAAANQYNLYNQYLHPNGLSSADTCASLLGGHYGYYYATVLPNGACSSAGMQSVTGETGKNPAHDETRKACLNHAKRKGLIAASEEELSGGLFHDVDPAMVPADMLPAPMMAYQAVLSNGTLERHTFLNSCTSPFSVYGLSGTPEDDGVFQKISEEDEICYATLEAEQHRDAVARRNDPRYVSKEEDYEILYSTPYAGDLPL